MQTVRGWVVKFNAHGPDGLIDRKARGQSLARQLDGKTRQIDNRLLRLMHAE